MSSDYTYVQEGTLAPPGPIGRITRAVLGAACLLLVYQVLLFGWGMVVSGDLDQLAWWPYIVLAVFLFPEVLNIGFSLRLGRRALRIGTVAVGVVLAGISKLVVGSFIGAPLGGIIFMWLLYTYGHLGISLLLAAVIRTPGCEMRAVPHLWSRLTHRSTKEHYCPGLFDPLDRWERRLKGSKAGKSSH